MSESLEDTVEALKREISSLKRSNKFGLKFEEKGEKIANKVNDHMPFLRVRADKSFVVDENAPTHELIKGDNYPALITLLNNYRNKVDVIYIDPPYNTGNNDFIYNDRYVDREDGYRHSTWLSFMKRRLELAKELLSDSGVIFVSIDDNEQAHLKILMDEVFGEQNFVGEMIRKSRTASSDSRTGVNIQHESCLVYAKSIEEVLLAGEVKDVSHYQNPDEDPRGRWISRDPTAASGTEKNIFPVQNPHTGKVDYPAKGRYWAFSENTLPGHIKSGKITFKKSHKDAERGFIYKGYLEEMRSRKKMINTLDFASNEYINSSGTKEIRNILESSFSAPKPVDFVKSLVSSVTHENKNAVILDFFAGSGTTGHAVAALNAEDGGTRKCVLVTDSGKSGNADNDDMSDNNKDGVDIAEDITYERMRRVLTGEDWANPDKAVALNQNLLFREVDFIAKNQVIETLGEGEDLVEEEVVLSKNDIVDRVAEARDSDEDDFFWEEDEENETSNEEAMLLKLADKDYLWYTESTASALYNYWESHKEDKKELG